MPLRSWLGRHIAPPRFILFIVVALGGFAAMISLGRLPWQMIALIAFDVAAILFLGSLLPLLDDRTPEEMRRDANANDANRMLVLIITALVAFVVMAAVWLEISAAKGKMGWSTLLVVLSLALSWLFSNTVYALHYAHLYYSRRAGGDMRGLDFPTDRNSDGNIDDDNEGMKPDNPNYWDFLYFSFTLGMTFQTSDTGITNTKMRQIVTLQSLVAFVFNIGVIAFTINVLGGSSN